MTDSKTFNLAPYQLAALLIVFMTAFSAPLTIVFNIGAIVSKFGATAAEAGFVITVEGICVSVAAIVCSRLITKYYLRTFLFVGMIMYAAGNALTLLAPDLNMMVLCRVMSGFGTGTVVCVVMAAAARTPKPEMTYGLVNGSAGAFIALLALAVPYVILRGGLNGAYGLYTALAIVGICLIAIIPNSKAPAHEPAIAATAGQSPKSKFLANSGWIALGGMGIFFFGQAGIAAFVERIGVNIEISLASIGFAFFVGGLLTIVGPVLAGIVGARFGSTRPLVIVSLLLCLTVLSIAVSGTKLGFYMGVPLIMVLPAIMLPSFLGGLAVIDPSGRLAGAQPAFATMGGALGPAAAGLVADASGFNGLGWFIVTVLIVAMVLMTAATFQADRMRAAA